MTLKADLDPMVARRLHTSWGFIQSQEFRGAPGSAYPEHRIPIYPDGRLASQSHRASDRPLTSRNQRVGQELLGRPNAPLHWF